MSLTVEQLTAIPRVQQVVPSPDGTWAAVVVSRLDGTGSKYITDLWRVPLDGKAPVRLTDGDAKDGGPAFRSDGGLYFLSNRPSPKDDAKDDDAPTQIWLLGSGEVGADGRDRRAAGRARIRRRAGTRTPSSRWCRGSRHGRSCAAQAPARAQQAGPEREAVHAMPIRFWDHWLGDVVPHPWCYRNGAAWISGPT
jgi:hypothetical protein